MPTLAVHRMTAIMQALVQLSTLRSQAVDGSLSPPTHAPLTRPASYSGRTGPLRRALEQYQLLLPQLEVRVIRLQFGSMLRNSAHCDFHLQQHLRWCPAWYQTMPTHISAC